MKIAGGRRVAQPALTVIFAPSTGRSALLARRGSATGLLSQAASRAWKQALQRAIAPPSLLPQGGRKGRRRHAHPPRRGRGTHCSVTKILPRDRGAARAGRAEREPPGARGAHGAASGIGPAKPRRPFPQQRWRKTRVIRRLRRRGGARSSLRTLEPRMPPPDPRPPDPCPPDPCTTQHTTQRRRGARNALVLAICQALFTAALSIDL